MPVDLRTGATEQIRVYAVGANGLPLTGLTDLYVRILRGSDGYFLDWADWTFKASGWTTLDKLLTQINATNAPGLYTVTGGLPTASITNPAADDVYIVIPLQTPGTNARLPSPDEIRMGRYVDQVNTIYGKLPTDYLMGSAVQSSKDDEIDAILADTNEIQGKLPTNYLMGSSTQADKDDEIDAILADTADMQPRVVAIETDTNEIQGKLPTNYLMGSSTQADKDDEIDAILADTAAMEPLVSANLDTPVSSRESEASASSRASTNQTEHDTTQAAIAALNDPSATEIADAVWDEALSGHAVGGTAGQALARVDVDVSTRAAPGAAMDLVIDALDSDALASSALADIADQVWEELLAGHVGVSGGAAEALNQAALAGTYTPTVIANAVWDADMAPHNGAGTAGQYQRRVDVAVSTRSVAGDPMDLIAGALDANSLDSSAALEIADAVWDETLSGHTGAGSAGQAQARLDATITSRAAPGAAMDLIAGAVDSDALATSGAQEIADAVWDEPLAGHAGAGTAGEAQARVDVAVSSRAAPGAQMALTSGERLTLADQIWEEPLADHLGAGTTGKALDDADATADPVAVAAAVWNALSASYVAPGSMGLLQGRLDAAISTRAAPGAPMDLQGGAIDAAAFAASGLDAVTDSVWDELLASHATAGSAGKVLDTRAAPGDAMDLVSDAVDAAALASSAVNEIADQVWEELIGDHSGTAGSVAEALDNVAAPASPATIAGAVWDEALAGHGAAGSAGEAQARLDAAITTRSSHSAADVNAAVTAAHGSGSYQTATGFATPANVSAAQVAVQNSITAAHAITDAGVAAVPAATESLNTAAHGAGSHQTATGFSTHTPADVADAVWDELHADHLAAGTTGKALQDASATADPAAIADAVWDEDLGGHSVVGSAGEAQTSAGAAGLIAEKIDGSATIWPPAPGSLLDRLTNKDGAQTYDQASDSLEALRDRVG